MAKMNAVTITARSTQCKAQTLPERAVPFPSPSPCVYVYTNVCTLYTLYRMLYTGQTLPEWAVPFPNGQLSAFDRLGRYKLLCIKYSGQLRAVIK